MNRSNDKSKLRAWTAMATVATVVLSASAIAQRAERAGNEVVDAVCASCHAKGLNGAPRIGDKAAWAKRASQGLTALTEHALTGIRNMPAHGGNAALSDIEIERAITYMVNQSGGNWVEPLGRATPAAVRGAKQIVQTQCAKCHQDGVNGAPKIGDRAAWIPRLSKGLDNLVKSAVHGRGHMPSRGGDPELSDVEIQGAVVYMFNYGVVTLHAPQPAATAVENPYHKVIDGADIYLGMMRADAIPAGQRQGTVPSGKGYYHVNISLFDVKTKFAITDAQVKVNIADPISSETKALEVISANNTISYGGYFRLTGEYPYTITAQVLLPGAASVSEAKFQYKAR